MVHDHQCRDLTSGPGGDFQSFRLRTIATGLSPRRPAGQIETCQLSLRFLPTLPGLRTAPLTITDSATSPATTYRFGLSGVGQSAQAIFIPGTIKTLAKSLATPSAIAIDSAGDVYYAESSGGKAPSRCCPQAPHRPTQLIAPAGPLTTPTALALDAAGNLYIADSTNNSIFEYDVNGVVTTLVSGLHNPVALAADTLGNSSLPRMGQRLTCSRSTPEASRPSLPAAEQSPRRMAYPQPARSSCTPRRCISRRRAHCMWRIAAHSASIASMRLGSFTGLPAMARLRIALRARVWALVCRVSPGSARMRRGDLYIADAVSNRIFLAFSGLAHNPEVSVLAGDGTAGIYR